ncbi:nuclear transport factor 2 family protein [Jiangella rhizosphaerae]|uniref:SnoaL-like domain-containing protein n=1 Tax=Jiangella rhizosphaerae TaxID=2293569 RepID=A0A418KW15_9ACTN|nr:nuclear transport factor 2 family protein [Jiangella rhizosphaerae]RIQ34867.1 hypothetical protein DY240_03110 [Jiangella rhizosphaerae]
MFGGSDERTTERRTNRFLAAFEREDAGAVRALLDPGVTFVNRMPLSGDRDDAVVLAGREAVMGYFQQVAQMGTIDFVGPDVTVAAGGGTSFAEADGDFVSADGRPYENVYAFRFDWRDGRIVAGTEYASPLTFGQTFPIEACA